MCLVRKTPIQSGQTYNRHHTSSLEAGRVVKMVGYPIGDTDRLFQFVARAALALYWRYDFQFSYTRLYCHMTEFCGGVNPVDLSMIDHRSMGHAPWVKPRDTSYHTALVRSTTALLERRSGLSTQGRKRCTNHPEVMYERMIMFSVIELQATSEPVTVFVFDFADKSPDKVTNNT